MNEAKFKIKEKIVWMVLFTQDNVRANYAE